MIRDDRTIVNIHQTPFDTYDLEGPAQEDMSLLPVSYDPETRRGIGSVAKSGGFVKCLHLPRGDEA